MQRFPGSEILHVIFPAHLRQLQHRDRVVDLGNPTSRSYRRRLEHHQGRPAATAVELDSPPADVDEPARSRVVNGCLTPHPGLGPRPDHDGGRDQDQDTNQNPFIRRLSDVIGPPVKPTRPPRPSC